MTICATRTTAATERVPGIVLGAAIGDALGYPVEFASMAAIRKRFGDAGITGYVDFRLEQGRRFAPYSDDTQLALVVLETLLASQQMGADLNATMNMMACRLVSWANNPLGGHRSPGAACLAGCDALAAGVPWHLAGAKTAGGCGSVMRVYPFALVFCDDPKRAESWAVAHSKLTHRSPIAFATCAAFVRGMLALLHDATPIELGEVMAVAAERYDPGTAKRLRCALNAALTREPPEIVLSRYLGWAAHDAVAAAYYVFVRHADDPQAALLEAVNSPGDSDSIGALVGALLGARHGMERLPTDWIRDLERSPELLTLAAQAQTLIARQLRRAQPDAKARTQTP